MGQQKLLLEVNGRSLIEHVVDAALGSAAAETVVVLGHEAERVRERLGARPVTVVVNSAFEEGMSTSLRVGLCAANPGNDGVVFLLGDQPFISGGLIDRLIVTFMRSGRSIVRPVIGDEPANPVLMSAALFPELLTQRGDVGGREIIERHPDDIDLVHVDDPWLAVDIDTYADYESARSRA